MNYLSIDAYIDFISGFNKNDFKDLQDLCVVVLLYESGARVSELINVRKRNLHLEKPYTVVLQGKGRKIRSVPLDYSVIKVLNKYIRKYNVSDEDFLFFNARRNKLTREGINYILQKHFKIAKEKNKLFLLCATEHNRKNWLFSTSTKGTKGSAAVFSLIETAKANKLDPYGYIEFILEYLPLQDLIEHPERLDWFLPWSEKIKEKFEIKVD